MNEHNIVATYEQMCNRCRIIDNDDMCELLLMLYDEMQMREMIDVDTHTTLTRQMNAIRANERTR